MSVKTSQKLVSKNGSFNVSNKFGCKGTAFFRYTQEGRRFLVTFFSEIGSIFCPQNLHICKKSSNFAPQNDLNKKKIKYYEENFCFYPVNRVHNERMGADRRIDGG